jgi:hypothetical protein
MHPITYPPNVDLLLLLRRISQRSPSTSRRGIHILLDKLLNLLKIPSLDASIIMHSLWPWFPHYRVSTDSGGMGRRNLSWRRLLRMTRAVSYGMKGWLHLGRRRVRAGVNGLVLGWGLWISISRCTGLVPDNINQVFPNYISTIFLGGVSTFGQQ